MEIDRPVTIEASPPEGRRNDHFILEPTRQNGVNSSENVPIEIDNPVNIEAPISQVEQSDDPLVTARLARLRYLDPPGKMQEFILNFIYSDRYRYKYISSLYLHHQNWLKIIMEG